MELSLCTCVIASLLAVAFFAGLRMFFVKRILVLKKRCSPPRENRTPKRQSLNGETAPRFGTPLDLHGGPASDSQANVEEVVRVNCSSDTEEPLPTHDQFSLSVRSTISGTNFEVSQTLWPRESLEEAGEAGPQSGDFCVCSETNTVFRDLEQCQVYTRNAPLQSESIQLQDNDMPLLESLMYPSVISTRMFPTEVLWDCFAILLKEVRKGLCTKRGFDIFFRLIRETGITMEDHATLEIMLGSTIISLLISRMTDENFKASGLFEEAFAALVRLLCNENVLNRSVQPKILEIAEWMLREGTPESKDHATIFALSICRQAGN